MRILDNATPRARTIENTVTFGGGDSACRRRGRRYVRLCLCVYVWDLLDAALDATIDVYTATIKLKQFVAMLSQMRRSMRNIREKKV